MMQVSNITYNDVLPKRYLTNELVVDSMTFDKYIGAYITILHKHGICSCPIDKKALVYDYFDRVGLDVNFNSTNTIMWVNGIEEGIIKLIK